MRLVETGLTVLRDGEFDDLGLIGTTGLGYLADAKYASKVNGPVITTQAIARDACLLHGVIVAEDPETAFWDLHERLAASGTFYDWSNDVYPVVLRPETVIQPSAVLGGRGFEVHNHKRVTHAGYVCIGERVSIGANSCVDRSIWKKPTSIGEDTHIDNLVHVAHNVQIGKRCFIAAGAIFAGSAVVGDDVFVGIGALVRPGVHIGDGAFIGMGVRVMRDVAVGERLVARND